MITHLCTPDSFRVSKYPFYFVSLFAHKELFMPTRPHPSTAHPQASDEVWGWLWANKDPQNITPFRNLSTPPPSLQTKIPSPFNPWEMFKPWLPPPPWPNRAQILLPHSHTPSYACKIVWPLMSSRGVVGERSKVWDRDSLVMRFVWGWGNVGLVSWRWLYESRTSPHPLHVKAFRLQKKNWGSKKVCSSGRGWGETEELQFVRRCCDAFGSVWGEWRGGLWDLGGWEWEADSRWWDWTGWWGHFVKGRGTRGGESGGRNTTWLAFSRALALGWIFRFLPSSFPSDPSLPQLNKTCCDRPRMHSLICKSVKSTYHSPTKPSN